ncbi:hypothetical protein GGF42_008741, partial [Coemansia sp. RSA 2424]
RSRSSHGCLVARASGGSGQRAGSALDRRQVRCGIARCSDGAGRCIQRYHRRLRRVDQPHSPRRVIGARGRAPSAGACVCPLGRLLLSAYSRRRVRARAGARVLPAAASADAPGCRHRAGAARGAGGPAGSAGAGGASRQQRVVCIGGGDTVCAGLRHAAQRAAGVRGGAAVCGSASQRVHVGRLHREPVRLAGVLGAAAGCAATVRVRGAVSVRQRPVPLQWRALRRLFRVGLGRLQRRVARPPLWSPGSPGGPRGAAGGRVGAGVCCVPSIWPPHVLPAEASGRRGGCAAALLRRHPLDDIRLCAGRVLGRRVSKVLHCAPAAQLCAGGAHGCPVACWAACLCGTRPAARSNAGLAPAQGCCRRRRRLGRQSAAGGCVLRARGAAARLPVGAAARGGYDDDARAGGDAVLLERAGGVLVRRPRSDQRRVAAAGGGGWLLCDVWPGWRRSVQQLFPARL